MKSGIYILMLSFIMLSCDLFTSEEKAIVTSEDDFNEYLAVNKARTSSPYFELWNSKITKDSMELPSFGAVAGQYNSFFQSTGDIEYLIKAEKALTRATEIANIDQEKYYRALARNYISQHRFKEALILADSAAALGPNITANQHLLFDVHMELGHYEKADSLQKLFADPYDFNYMIRAAKWNDHQGDLDRTIMFMEKAKQKAEESKNRELLLWVYSNLGDYYGHAGRIQDSYEHYLKTLEIDPANAYAKKGIAWIVFSHERNAEGALDILEAILKSHVSPDIYLLRAEIAEYKGDEDLYIDSMEQYWNLVKKTGYGEMYNAHNLKLFLGQPGNELKALDLARKEVVNRQTPETYHLLALAHLKNDNKAEALKIIDNNVKGKTYEPEALLSMAKIYKANGMSREVKNLKAELLEAKYELGPVTHAEVLAL